ncbi:hypothetical protein KC19_2G105200 [Ceratodon purpureus]|uniref:Secreted protein n=1 Tax=Ceratodon purpureus TaxID=3225 RepID=A0A8T0IWA5_CERPU|nr:hypothetical protein KC19_2G105200 [Ceratodon purpureus]
MGARHCTLAHFVCCCCLFVKLGTTALQCAILPHIHPSMAIFALRSIVVFTRRTEFIRIFTLTPDRLRRTSE